jgi:hypothetical protein
MARPWFVEDFPLDFSREDTRSAEAALIKAYGVKKEVVSLFENVGLDPASLDQDGAIRFIWRDVLKAASIGGRLLRLLAEVMQDPAKAGPAAVLLAKQLAGHEAKLSAAVFDWKPSVALLGTAATAISARGKGGFEKVINVAAGFSDVPTFLTKLAEAQVRTARILIGKKPNGTGFLVGDSLLLTNWHVVENAKGPLTAEFDYNSSGKPREVPFTIEASNEYAPIADELGETGPPGDKLDFALCRLAEPVGDQGLGTKRDGDKRRFIELQPGVVTFDLGDPILIVGHPKTRPLQLLSYASPSGAKLTDSKTRVRYNTNTEGGSSGSPVFDKEWRLVALHNGSGPTDEPSTVNVPGGVFNQGIPVSLIAAHLKATKPELYKELCPS